MKTIFKIFLAVAVLSTSLQSCETIELEQLANPLALGEADSDADFLLNSIQRAYVTNMITYNDR
ncbi:MAG: SusD/RagB family nutrient-binding outer membrane lipoprotein, partial [Gilvibacter sp.]